MRRVACCALPFVGSTAVRCSSAFAEVKMGPPDAILGLTAAFKEDKFPKKVNLGVGAYRCGDGKPFVLNCVSEASHKILVLDKEYAAISGLAGFVSHAQKLVLGPDHKVLKEKRIASAQSISGTGALRLAGEFLDRHYSGNKTIYVSDPTWGNHIPIFKDSYLKVEKYPYFDQATCGLKLTAMLEALEKAPERSIVLLHSCAHNPTGVDPTPDEWKQILEVVKRKNHFPLMDTAYQGFASGDPERDAYAVRLFADNVDAMMICQSFAKNFGLYGERCGNFSIICSDAAETERVLSQLKILVRPMYSNPPINGARIVDTILDDPELMTHWRKEVKLMADRIISMRQALVKELTACGSTRNWSHIEKQIGMFAYTGLSKDQCNALIKEHHIYLTGDGRISMAGLNDSNVKYVAGAIHAVTK